MHATRKGVSEQPERKDVGTHVSERGTHDDRVVTVLLVVVVDLGNRDNSGVGRSVVVTLGLVLLVPVEDTSDEGRDEGDLGFGTCNGLLESEEEREVAVDVVLGFELTGGLDTLPGRGDLDEDSVLADADLLVEGDQVLGLRVFVQRGSVHDRHIESEIATHLGLGGLLVEGEGSVDLGRDTSGNDGEDLLSELDELEEVRCKIVQR